MKKKDPIFDQIGAYIPEKTYYKTKLKEAISSVLPIAAIVVILCAFPVPLGSGLMLSFLTGAVMLMCGMALFSIGAEMSVSKMGEYVGSYIPKTRRLIVVIAMSFILGLIITVSEPDLMVLAELIPSVPSALLIISVGCGVGVFLVAALLRMLFGIPLPRLLCILYALVFVLAFFTPRSFLSIAFDSGGVTTGPMTVPFIMSLGLGVCAIRSDRHAEDDSFGLVALCSVGPIISVLILGMIFSPTGGDDILERISDAPTTDLVVMRFAEGFPEHAKEIGISLMPIAIFMLVFNGLKLHLGRRPLGRIVTGIVYTCVGLILFLTGANVGFMPIGRILGTELADPSMRYMIVPIGMIMGYFTVKAEPAVYVLNKQVEEITNGNISAGAMGTALSLGVAVSVGLAMIRVLTGAGILWFVLPGYLIAIVLSFMVPKLYTAIAFDSGGVASGPMTAAFIVPFAQGACAAVGGDMMTDAFGVVAMVAMTPLITVQLMGLISVIKDKQAAERRAIIEHEFENMDDDAIILI
ncbi:MAG: DUF1538 domain-containing protein [Oscillospiraceae bacterium]|nr:DUF1538 domain-containing protein [Oscillospiraceae bacterium]